MAGMAPEVETLDQLLAGPLLLTIIRTLYPDNARFVRGVFGLLESGDTVLRSETGAVLSKWQWQMALGGDAAEVFTLELTHRGADRIG